MTLRLKNNNGFTLIELVVVIVILGILAVVAAPKFLNLQEDARDSALAGLAGSIDGAAGIVYGKAAIEGKESLDAEQTVSEDTVPGGIKTLYGYPRAIMEDLKKVIDGLDEDDGFIKKDIGIGATPSWIKLGFDGYDHKCVMYTEATKTSAATTSILTDNCSY
ncbi:type II secretion system protein [Vibrio harveyi]|nr:type II secretion system protein [Vibrio harveyi]